MQVIAVSIQRGGTAKTTTAAALAQAAAYRGKTVLAIDLDPQGNLSLTLGADATQPGSYELLTGSAAAYDLVQHCNGIDVIPASWNLATLRSESGSARRLQKAISAIRYEYDLTIIDTPPTAGELQYNALQAATGIIIPLQADIFGLQGLYQIADTAAQIQKTNKQLSIKGIIFTRHNPRTTITQQMQEATTKQAQSMNIPVLGAIREAVAVREAQTLQRSLYEYAPKCKPAQDYLEIFDKLGV